MYRVYADSTLICDSRDDELAIINPVVTLEANKAGTFVFTLPATHPFYSTIERRQTIVKVYKDKSTTPLFEGLATGVMIDFWKQKQITCEGIMTVFNDTLQRQARYEVDSTTAVRDLLKSFIDIHNSQNDIKFEVGSVTVTDSNGYIACFTNYESTMDCLSADLVEDYGGYLRLRYDGDTRYIDYLLDSPRTCTQAVRLGENLVDFDIEYDTNELCTVLVPLGATLEDRTSSAIEGLDEKLTIQSVNNGKDYIESASAIESFGRITKTVEWSEVTVASNLLRKGKEYLESAQFETMTITANAIDLYALGEADQSFELLDKIRVVSKPHGMDKYFILTQMTLNLNNPENDTITLGGSGSVGISAKANSASESILKEIEKIQPSSILQSARDNATSLITSSTEGYVTLIKTDDGKNVKELVITDTPNYKDATKCWRWNSGGFGYSANGYDGDYNLAMTMDGSIVADFINTGKMSVDRLTGKIGAGADVSIVWDAIADGTSKATQITKDTVTTSYINALNVTAGSVAAENITGTTISGKTITGGKIITEAGQMWITDIYANGGNGISLESWTIINGDLSLGTGASEQRYIYNYMKHATDFLPSRVGKIDIGTASYYWATVNAMAFNTVSDRRKKDNIKDLSSAYLDFFYNLKPKSYTLKEEFSKDSTEIHTGFIAQDVEENLHDVGLDSCKNGVFVKEPIKDDDGNITDYTYSLNYIELIAISTKAIHELKKEIDVLKEEIKMLKGE